MSFKTQQVLRTKVPVKTTDGKQVSPGTRVVVMSMLEDGKVRTKVTDGDVVALAGLRIEAGVGAFTLTHRGRPRKSE